jgi:hypothetical protein
MLLSIRRANVGDLVVSGLDLSCCRFAGAHNLERLRLEGETNLASPPSLRATRRTVIAEEQEWRAARTGWRARGWNAPSPIGRVERKQGSEVLEPGAIAVIYRALRKGREDEGNAPGAADFYYGEMEMRRHDEGTNRAERLTIWLYWLVSGYGLRGLRAPARSSLAPSPPRVSSASQRPRT